MKADSTTAETDTAKVDGRTTRRRWNDAVGALHRAGIFVRQNLETCCGSCAFYEVKHRNCHAGEHVSCGDGDQFAYTRAPQGCRQFWDGDVLLQVESGDDPLPAKKIYWEHGSDDQATMNLIALAFRANGFEVEDGTPDMYPAIILDEVDQHVKYLKLIGFPPMSEQRIESWRQSIATKKIQFQFADSAPSIPDVEPFEFRDQNPFA